MFFLLILIIPFLHFTPNTAIPHVQPHPNTTIVAPKVSRGFSVPLYHRAMLYREEFNLTKTTSSNYDAQKTMFTTGLYDRLNGVYVAYFMVGDPPQRQALLLDIGSDLLWVQCQPCITCFNQTDDLEFDPKESSSYREIPCNSALCNHDEDYIFSCDATIDRTSEKDCRFEIEYADDSSASGKMIIETLGFFSDVRPLENIVVGCANNNQGHFDEDTSGILGLGLGYYSLTNQLKVTNFSFCLPGPDFIYGSTLDMFYTEPEKDNTITVPLLLNPLHPSHYFVGFQGISLNNQMVPIPSSYWEFSTDPKSNIDGGVLVDSGASVSWMPTQVYEIFSTNFVQLTNMIQEKPPDSTTFNTCFSTRSTSRSVPEVKFHFTNTYSLTLTMEQLFWRYALQNKPDMLCLAFHHGLGFGFTIIGSKQLQGARQTYDLVNMNLKLTPNECY
ncbi:protein ASPARTIC PROTEASE IN GUARD CELL 1-like [Quercus robur]|uniref:protein ASPARTIC PROTEASE IN GUARD CELL 1-like n=1 Tax=Quercus robur TaxID=38942 RepID=UPI0021638088|nr:protein ASPARTIC PROTEASE IN GUARD CELL 1-like [Quercus robur]